jgi:F420H(2)-dependent quinone reductase
MVEINWYPLPVSARDRAGLGKRCGARGGRLTRHHNLKANPACTLTVGGQSLDCTAREVSGEERDHRHR